MPTITLRILIMEINGQDFFTALKGSNVPQPTGGSYRHLSVSNTTIQPGSLWCYRDHVNPSVMVTNITCDGQVEYKHIPRSGFLNHAIFSDSFTHIQDPYIFNLYFYEHKETNVFVKTLRWIYINWIGGSW